MYGTKYQYRFCKLGKRIDDGHWFNFVLLENNFKSLVVLEKLMLEKSMVTSSKPRHIMFALYCTKHLIMQFFSNIFFCFFRNWK